MITKTLQGCSYTEFWVSPANWQKATKKDLSKEWFVECVFFDPRYQKKYPNRELIEYECCESNITRDIYPKKTFKEPRLVLKKNELDRVREHLEEEHPDFYRYMMIFLYSGARNTELFRLHWIVTPLCFWLPISTRIPPLSIKSIKPKRTGKCLNS